MYTVVVFCYVMESADFRPCALVLTAAPCAVDLNPALDNYFFDPQIVVLCSLIVIIKFSYTIKIGTQMHICIRL